MLICGKVQPSELSTSIAEGRESVKTIEHLMAAINALSIDNLVIAIEGDEVPILDGSSKFFYEGLQKAGIIEQSEAKRFLQIIKPIEVTDNKNGVASLTPASSSSFQFFIDFDHKAIGQQDYSLELCHQSFEKEISSARTFGFEKDLSTMQEKRAC